jgi:hypothetical protein
MEQSNGLAADRAQVAQFVSTLFRYAVGSDTFVSLRAFDQVRRDVPPILVRPVQVNGSLDPLIDQAVTDAEHCANAGQPCVFCPPVCTFANAQRARGVDLALGLVLSLELDEGDTNAAWRKLDGLLGPVTLAVASGGEWIDPTTGEIFPKIHLHWRLSEPTQDADDHAMLRLARDMAARLVGADPTGKPVVHPLRWPGSWNLKGQPVMAHSITSTRKSISLTLSPRYPRRWNRRQAQRQTCHSPVIQRHRSTSCNRPPTLCQTPMNTMRRGSDTDTPTGDRPAGPMKAATSGSNGAGSPRSSTRPNRMRHGTASAALSKTLRRHAPSALAPSSCLPRTQDGSDRQHSDCSTAR